MRISNSFSEGEIQVLDFILTTLLRGGTPNMAVRSKDFASLCRKVQSMKTRVADIESGKRAPARSSVGVIDAPEGEEDESDIDTSDEDLASVG